MKILVPVWVSIGLDPYRPDQMMSGKAGGMRIQLATFCRSIAVVLDILAAFIDYKVEIERRNFVSNLINSLQKN